METLLTKEEILAAAEPMVIRKGLYFLLLEKEIVYIGQSLAVEERIVAAAKTDKEFDSYMVLTCDELSTAQMLDKQAEYIVQHNPIYNTALPVNKKWAALGTIRRMASVNYNVIKKHIRQNRIKDTNGFYRLADFAEFLPDRDDES